MPGWVLVLTFLWDGLDWDGFGLPYLHLIEITLEWVGLSPASAIGQVGWGRQ